MFEQRIYGRARESFTRGDGVTVRIGYGYLAESRGFSRTGSRVNDMTGQFPTELTDGLGAYPAILVKKRFTLDSGEEAQLIQQTVLSGSDRASAMTHQVVADGASVTEFVRRPDLWMNIRFAAEEYNWATVELPSTASIPVSNSVQVAPFANVLAFFGMGTDTFTALLCSLFDSIRSPGVFTVVAFRDDVPGYDYWIRCLIVYIYYFLPLSVRRRMGFETWMTGTVDSRGCELYFVPARNLRSAGERYSAVISRAARPAELSDAFLFWGDGFRHRDGTPLPGETYASETAYRAFVRPWVEAAHADGVNGAGRVNALSVEYWELFDRSETGRGALTPDRGFDELGRYQALREGRLTLTSAAQLERLARAFSDNLCDEALELLASAIPRDLIGSIRAAAQQSELPAQEYERAELCALLELMDGRCGNAITDVVANTVAALLHGVSLDRRHLRPVTQLAARGLLSVDDAAWLRMLSPFTRETSGCADCELIAQTAADCAGMCASGMLSAEVRDAAAAKLIELLPAPLTLTAQVRGLAAILRAAPCGGFVAAHIVGHMRCSLEDYARECPALLEAFPQPEAHAALLEGIERAERPAQLDGFLRALTALHEALPDDGAALLGMAAQYASGLRLPLDSAVGALLALRSFGAEQSAPIARTLLQNALPQTADPAGLLRAMADCAPELRRLLLAKVLSDDARPLPGVLRLLADSAELLNGLSETIEEYIAAAAPSADAVLELLGAMAVCEPAVAGAMAALLPGSVGLCPPDSAVLPAAIARVPGLPVDMREGALCLLLAHARPGREGLNALPALESVSLGADAARLMADYALSALPDCLPMRFADFAAADSAAELLLRSGHAQAAGELLDSAASALQSAPPADVDRAPEYAARLIARRGIAGVEAAAQSLLTRYADTPANLAEVLSGFGSDALMPAVLAHTSVPDAHPTEYIALIATRCGELPVRARDAAAERIAECAYQARPDVLLLCRVLHLQTEGMFALPPIALGLLIDRTVYDEFDMAGLRALANAMCECAELRPALFVLTDRYIRDTVPAFADVADWAGSARDLPAAMHARILARLAARWQPLTESEAEWSAAHLACSVDQEVAEAAEGNLRAFILKPGLSLTAPDFALAVLHTRLKSDSALMLRMLEAYCAEAKALQYAQLMLDSRLTGAPDSPLAQLVRGFGLSVIRRQNVDLLLDSLADRLRYERPPLAYDAAFVRELECALTACARRGDWTDDTPGALRRLVLAWNIRPRNGSELSASDNSEVIFSAAELLAEGCADRAERKNVRSWLLSHIRAGDGPASEVVSKLLDMPDSPGKRRALLEQLAQPADRFKDVNAALLLDWLDKAGQCDVRALVLILDRLPALGRLGCVRAGSGSGEDLRRFVLGIVSDGDPTARAAAADGLAGLIAPSLSPAGFMPLAGRMLERAEPRTVYAVLARAVSLNAQTAEYAQSLFGQLRDNAVGYLKRLETAMELAAALYDETVDAIVIAELYRFLKPCIIKPRDFCYALKALSAAPDAARYAKLLTCTLEFWISDLDAQQLCRKHLGNNAATAPQIAWKAAVPRGFEGAYRQWLRGYVYPMAAAAFDTAPELFGNFVGGAKCNEIFAAWPALIRKTPFEAVAVEGFAALCAEYMNVMHARIQRRERSCLYLPRPFDPERPEYADCIRNLPEGALADAEPVLLCAYMTARGGFNMARLPQMLERFLNLFGEDSRSAARAALGESARAVCALLRHTEMYIDYMALYHALMLWSRSKTRLNEYCMRLMKPNCEFPNMAATIALLERWKAADAAAEAEIRAELDSVISQIMASPLYPPSGPVRQWREAVKSNKI